MGIMNFIQQEKEKFRDAQFNKKAELAKIESEHLKRERARLAELAKAQSEKVVLEKDVAKLSAFTEKHKDLSSAQKFGRGLAAVMNKAKTGIKEHKAQVAKRGGGLSIGVPMSSGSRGIDTQSRNVFGGASRDVFGGASRDVFSGPVEKPKESRPRVIIIR